MENENIVTIDEERLQTLREEIRNKYPDDNAAQVMELQSTMLAILLRCMKTAKEMHSLDRLLLASAGIESEAGQISILLLCGVFVMHKPTELRNLDSVFAALSEDLGKVNKAATKHFNEMEA